MPGLDDPSDYELFFRQPLGLGRSSDLRPRIPRIGTIGTTSLGLLVGGGMEVFTEWWRETVFGLREHASDDVIVVLLGFVTMLFTYYTTSFLLLITDATQVPAWLSGRRIQKSRPFAFEKTSYNPSFATLMGNVLANQFVVILPTLFVLQAVTGGVYLTPSLPPWREIVYYQLPATLLLVETLFYWSHRSLHHPKIYKYVHKKHHEYKAPHAFAAIYAHWFEALVGNCLCVMGPAFVLRFHALTFMAGMAIGWVQTCLGHSGYLLPGDKHDLHHSLTHCWFGTYGLWDWVCGTGRVKQLGIENRRLSMAKTRVE